MRIRLQKSSNIDADPAENGPTVANFSTSRSAREVQLATLGPGACWGELSLLGFDVPVWTVRTASHRIDRTITRKPMVAQNCRSPERPIK